VAVHRKLHEAAWAPPESPPPVDLRAVMRAQQTAEPARAAAAKAPALPQSAKWAAPVVRDGQLVLAAPPPPVAKGTSLRAIQEQEQRVRSPAQPLGASVWGLIAPSPQSFADVLREERAAGRE